MAQMHEAVKNIKGPQMGALDAGQRVLQDVRNNDLYILTTPQLEAEFRAGGEAIVASLATDMNPPEARATMGQMILGKMVYATERDRGRCERANTRVT